VQELAKLEQLYETESTAAARSLDDLVDFLRHALTRGADA